jgi:hypothetical protein
MLNRAGGTSPWRLPDCIILNSTREIQTNKILIFIQIELHMIAFYKILKITHKAVRDCSSENQAGLTEGSNVLLLKSLRF